MVEINLSARTVSKMLGVAFDVWEAVKLTARGKSYVYRNPGRAEVVSYPLEVRNGE